MTTEGWFQSACAWLGQAPLHSLGVVLALLAVETLLWLWLRERFLSGSAALRSGLDKAETHFLFALLISLTGLSFMQVVLRLSHGGLPWVDVVNRHLVLWIGMVGAALATSRGRHIRIDVLGRLLKGDRGRWVGALLDLLAAWICLRLALASLTFVLQTREFGDTLAPLEWPAWMLQAVIPASFALMSLHFLLNPPLRWRPEADTGADAQGLHP
jgi:TRAP-type C4-dicarboxylate transport system permease small subunit